MTHYVAQGRADRLDEGAGAGTGSRAEARVAIERLLDRTTEIRIDEAVHGPADARRYQYPPTHILRGPTHLILEFTL